MSPDPNIKQAEKSKSIGVLQIFIYCHLPLLVLVLISFSFFKFPNNSKVDLYQIPQENSEKIREELKKNAEVAIAQVKSDLYGQIAFPVIFSIVSIFAAFAVKDILIEVLKQEEKKQIQIEIEEKLQELNKSIPQKLQDYSKKDREELNKKIEKMEGYINWLEHKISRIFIDREIDFLRERIASNPHFNISEIPIELGILIKRSAITLERSNKVFSKTYLQELEKHEEVFISHKLEELKISKGRISSLYHRLDEDQSQLDVYPGLEIFRSEIALLLLTLERSSNGPMSKDDLNLLREFLLKDHYKEYEEKKLKNISDIGKFIDYIP